MEEVSQSEVIRYWLDRETAKRAGEVLEASELSCDEALDALLDRKPGTADFLWRHQPVQWYRLDLPRSAFEDLRVIGGPKGLLWRALAPDGTVTGAARRIADAEAPETLRAETGVDVETILAYRDAIAAGEAVGLLVVATRRGCAPWYVADGNHRATARALHLLETGRYEPQPAFLGVGGNPVLRPLRQRLCGLLRRLRGERPPFEPR